MRSRERLLAAATDMVIERDAEGAVIDVDAEAAELLRAHPNSGMTSQEVVAHIQTMAVIVGAALLSGTSVSAAA